MGILVNSVGAGAIALASVVLSSPAAAQAWEPVCEQGEVCSVNGTRAVRYGARDKYFIGVATNTISCTNTVFGNPISDVTKRCYAYYTAAELAARSARQKEQERVRALEQQARLLPQRDERIRALEREVRAGQAELNEANAELDELYRELRRERRRDGAGVIIRRDAR